jgi:hypothetical protein
VSATVRAVRNDSTVVVAPTRTNWSPVWLTRAALYSVSGRAAVISAPSSARRALVGCAVSALYRITRRASIPCSITATVPIARWRRVIILSVDGRECANRDCADKTRSQEDSRSCTHVSPRFSHCSKVAPNCFSLSRHLQ